MTDIGMSPASEKKAAKFRQIGQKRVNNAIKTISLIGNLSNRNAYEYSDSDITKMMTALRDAIEKTEARFNTTPKKINGGFSF